MAMILVNIPLGRKADTDIIRIDNCPSDFSKDDCKVYEEYLRN